MNGVKKEKRSVICGVHGGVFGEGERKVFVRNVGVVVWGVGVSDVVDVIHD